MRFARFTAALIVCAGAIIFCHAPGAGAAAPSSAMLAPVRALVRFVNTGAMPPHGTYARGAVVVDEFAPFAWTSGTDATRWPADFTSSNAKAGITNPRFAVGAPTEFNVAGSHAYVVFPGVFTPRLDGKPFTETGYWTFVLVKDGVVWRVAAQAWAGVTFK